MKMKNGKRVLLFIDNMGAGGAQRQMAYLACLLMRRGYVVKLITYGDNSFYAPMLKSGGVLTEEIDGADSYIKRIPKVRIAIDEFKPDCVISFLDTPCIIASLIKAVYRKKWRLVVSERNTTQKMTLRERIKFYLYKYADAIVPNSHSQESFLRQNYPSMSSKIRTITNFVDTEKFRIDICSEKKNRIVSVGRITPQKNILNYIQAAKQVIDQGFEVTFDWFGNTDMPEYEQACYGLIKELCMENHFVFHKAVTDIIPEYQKSLAFCLPSIYEGFPNVVCEAMSCGIPVLCSNVCDNPKIITSEQYGFLFNPNNVNDISKNIIRYLKLGKERTDKMGQNCRNVAITMFSKQTFVKQYIELIER